MEIIDWLKKILSLTPRQYLERAQKKSPPLKVGSQHDLGKELYARLEQRLPMNIGELFKTGVAVIGEIGVLTPGAFAQPVWPSGYTIQVHTGLSRFLYSISRVLAARAMTFSGTDGGRIQHPSDTIEKTVEVIDKIFFTLMDAGKIATPSDYEISFEQKQMASALSTHAETFVVAHEIGHIHLWSTQFGSLETHSLEQESEADKIALALILGVVANPIATKNISMRMAYAGAEFAVRVFAGLEHLGYKFDEGMHPLPSRRLEEIRNLARDFCVSHRRFMQLSTIAFTYDQLLEEVERRLAEHQAPGQFVLGVTSERLLSTMMVLIEECIKNMVTEKFVVDETTKAFDASPLDVVKQTAREAASMYLVEPLINPTVEEEAFAVQEGEKFKKIIQLLPQPWCQIFTDAVSNLNVKKAPAVFKVVLNTS